MEIGEKKMPEEIMMMRYKWRDIWKDNDKNRD